MGDEASNANLIFHPNELELLREQIRGGMPDSPHPLDGQLYIPHEPIPASRLTTETQASTATDDPFAPLNEAKRKAVELGKTFVCTQFGPKCHYFLVDDLELINQVTRIWQQQLEITGYDIKFVIEAVARYNLPDNTWDRYLFFDKLFKENALPEGFVQATKGERKDLPENSTRIIFYHSGAGKPHDATVAARRSELEDYLRAYTLHQGVGFRLVRQTVKPIGRRSLSVNIGPEHASIPAAQPALLNHIRQCVNSNPHVKTAADGLNSALCALDEQDTVTELWCTLEELFKKAGEPLLIKPEKDEAKRFLKDLLGKDRGNTAYECLCDLNKQTRNQTIAAALHEVVPDYAREDWYSFVRETAKIRGQDTHSLGEAEDVSEYVRRLMDAILRFITQECRASRS